MKRYFIVEIDEKPGYYPPPIGDFAIYCVANRWHYKEVRANIGRKLIKPDDEEISSGNV